MECKRLLRGFCPGENYCDFYASLIEEKDPLAKPHFENLV